MEGEYFILIKSRLLVKLSSFILKLLFVGTALLVIFTKCNPENRQMLFYEIEIFENHTIALCSILSVCPGMSPI